SAPSGAAGSRWSWCFCGPLLVDLLAAVGALANADVQLLVLDGFLLHPDPRRPVAGRADDHHVGDRHGRCLLDHAAWRHLRPAHPAGVAHRLRTRMALDRVQVLDDHAALGRARVEDAALLTAVLALDHVDEVALLDFHFRCHFSYSTSGARLTIFMKLRSRNSRATGPKMRVPRGLFALSMITAAFSSKAIEVPSSRPNGLRVRTTTAWTTSPVLFAPCGLGGLMVGVIL